ncbi:MAG TPA: cyclic-phosphate processing receiver domain-containing protein [Pyrinomonadaceae bacterium]|nr:cyclic-phosphate processing receiver domain-containing protein [Pyrinomonadaceae bacterium]
MSQSDQTAAALRVLIVEDTEERQNVLMSLYRAHAWILAATGRRAVTLLNAYDFDIISLDYNLRGPLTGAEVAQAIASSRNQNTRVVIHSMNPKGAIQIAQLLPDAVQFPVSKMVGSNRGFKTLRNKIDELGAAYDWH